MKNKTKVLVVVSIFVAVLSWIAVTGIRSSLDQTSAGQKRVQSSDDLIDAINLGDVRRVQTLLDSGANPNAQGPMFQGVGGLSALLIASEKADNGIVDLLIKKGADVNAADPRGYTPLMIASAVGHVRAVKALVSAGANLNAKRPNNETALAIAREADEKEVVSLLQKSGAK